MNRTNVLLLSGTTLVMTAAIWRLSSAEAIAPRPPLQLSAPKIAATAAAAAPNKPAAVSKRAAANNAADGETPDDYVYVPPPRPKRAVAADASTPVAAPRASAVVETTAAPHVVASTASPEYERAVADAGALGADDLDRAARRLERLAADEPGRPGAYESLAAIRLQQGDYYQAFAMFGSAIRSGGTATFAIMHDHTRGNFDSGPRDTCAGRLAISTAGVRFEGADGHQFAASWTDVEEAGANRFFGSGIGGFHVKVAVAEGKSRNFNLAPKSRDKREANIILDLLIENAERNDRGK